MPDIFLSYNREDQSTARRFAEALAAEALSYGLVAELAHGADQIVVAEIENWQAVFGGKHITVPA
jgi:hypothetical protein